MESPSLACTAKQRLLPWSRRCLRAADSTPPLSSAAGSMRWALTRGWENHNTWLPKPTRAIARFSSFRQFWQWSPTSTASTWMVVLCNDDQILRRILPQIQRRVATYGRKRGSDFLIRVQECGFDNHQGLPISRFEVTYRGTNLGAFQLRVPGVHNVLNATAAIAVGVGLDIQIGQVRSALENFRGVDRRFQWRGKVAGISVIDDYGHHPTEIKATLAAARQCGFRRIHVIFQPHRYTRTRDL